LRSGKDWCHFSIPAELLGEWFKEYSRNLGSERQWIKLSYLWLASADFPAPRAGANARRLVSDPLPSTTGKPMVLICEPEKVARLETQPGVKLKRGDLITQEKVVL
jgi:hypothetical protein